MGDPLLHPPHLDYSIVWRKNEQDVHTTTTTQVTMRVESFIVTASFRHVCLSVWSSVTWSYYPIIQFFIFNLSSCPPPPHCFVRKLSVSKMIHLGGPIFTASPLCLIWRRIERDGRWVTKRRIPHPGVCFFLIINNRKKSPWAEYKVERSRRRGERCWLFLSPLRSSLFISPRGLRSQVYSCHIPVQLLPTCVCCFFFFGHVHIYKRLRERERKRATTQHKPPLLLFFSF